MSTAIMIVLAFVAIFFITLIIKGVRIVPEQSAVMIERLGKFRTQLDAGLNIIIPVVDQARSLCCFDIRCASLNRIRVRI